jgi:hypothetical protein
MSSREKDEEEITRKKESNNHKERSIKQKKQANAHQYYSW